jgi:nucleoside-diphosphate-sugar epimerase
VTTRENSPIDSTRTSHYGFHKLVAEEIVRHYAPGWLILRLAGMVGPGLRKNPIYDILHGQPLRIHPDSQYQFLHSRDVAGMGWKLVESGARQDIFNVCGDGLISPREVAALAGVKMDLSLLPADARPRIVNVSVEKLQAIQNVPSTREAIVRFVQDLIGGSSGPLGSS